MSLQHGLIRLDGVSSKQALLSIVEGMTEEQASEMLQSLALQGRQDTADLQATTAETARAARQRRIESNGMKSTGMK